MTTQKTKLQIIEETVAAYADPSNRAIKDGRCMYKDHNGNKCALGRCFNEGCDDAVFDYAYNASNLFIQFPMNDILKPEYQGNETKFWCALQSLHDRKGYFTDGGFSDEGLRYIAWLNSEYANQ